MVVSNESQRQHRTGTGPRHWLGIILLSALSWSIVCPFSLAVASVGLEASKGSFQPAQATSTSRDLIAYLLLSVAALLCGAGIGFAQRLIVEYTGLTLRPWIRPTAIGWWLGFSAILASLITVPQLNVSAMGAGLAMLSGTFIAFATSACQWLSLRKKINYGLWWVVANTASGTVGGASVVGVYYLLERSMEKVPIDGEIGLAAISMFAASILWGALSGILLACLATQMMNLRHTEK